MEKDGEKSTAEKIINVFEEDEMKKEVKKEVIRLLKETRESRGATEIVREVKIQHSKQLFIRIPKDLERLLHLKEGGIIKFIIKIPRENKEKIEVKLDVKNG